MYARTPACKVLVTAVICLSIPNSISDGGCNPAYIFRFPTE